MSTARGQPRRVVLAEQLDGRWSVEPDVGAPVTDLADLWEAGQIASNLDGSRDAAPSTVPPPQARSRAKRPR